MPKLSPTMEEGQISRWVKNEGEKFDANETLAEVDTDKATMEMTALSGGTLLKILKQAGETAALGEPIAITGNAGEDISTLLNEVPRTEPKTAAAAVAQARQKSPPNRKNSPHRPQLSRNLRSCSSKKLPSRLPSRRPACGTIWDSGTTGQRPPDRLTHRGPNGRRQRYRSQVISWLRP